MPTQAEAIKQGEKQGREIQNAPAEHGEVTTEDHSASQREQRENSPTATEKDKGKTVKSKIPDPAAPIPKNVQVLDRKGSGNHYEWTGRTPNKGVMAFLTTDAVSGAVQYWEPVACGTHRSLDGHGNEAAGFQTDCDLCLDQAQNTVEWANRYSAV